MRVRERVANWIEVGHVVIGGDMNVAPTDSDIFHPDAFGLTHVSAPERERPRRVCSGRD
jgi:exodeoxyribonuclease-3